MQNYLAGKYNRDLTKGNHGGQCDTSAGVLTCADTMCSRVRSAKQTPKSLYSTSKRAANSISNLHF